MYKLKASKLLFAALTDLKPVQSSKFRYEEVIDSKLNLIVDRRLSLPINFVNAILNSRMNQKNRNLCNEGRMSGRHFSEEGKSPLRNKGRPCRPVCFEEFQKKIFQIRNGGGQLVDVAPDI